jgi:hypothetical protein
VLHVQAMDVDSASNLCAACIYLNEQVGELLPQSLNFAHRLRHELLATKSGLDSHDQYLATNNAKMLTTMSCNKSGVCAQTLDTVSKTWLLEASN